jgi:hypothetical protein
MRIFLVAADIFMGLILGVFVYVAASKAWAPLQSAFVAVVILAASVLLVLFRKPSGSLARRGDDRPGK